MEKEYKFYLKKDCRDYFMNGLEYIINKCYDLKSISKENTSKLFSLDEIEDFEFYIKYKPYDGNDEIEREVYNHANYSNFTLIFESCNLNKYELEKILKNLETKGYIYKTTFPEGNIILDYLSLMAITKDDKKIQFELIPGKIKYKIEKNSPIFIDSILLYLEKFNELIEDIKIKLEVDEIFGYCENNGRFEEYFLDNLEKIYKEIEKKYKPKIEFYGIDIQRLALLQETSPDSKEFEREFEKLLSLVESGAFSGKIVLDSSKWSSLKDKYLSARKISESNIELYNRLCEIYDKYKNDKDKLINSYIKLKEIIKNEKELKLIKEFFSEVLNKNFK
ncbi:MAG: hypothetical protein QXM27_01670 [Candidatus Pacearchaeota archaeon]